MYKSKIVLSLLILMSMASKAQAATAVGTETILNNFYGVNLHMENCCKGNYGNTAEVITQIQYIGARRLRDWATTDTIVNEWLAINKATGATFHASIPETSPAKQRIALTRIKNWLKSYPNLIDVIEGSNEPDVPYSISQGASLADSANLQTDVYKVGSTAGVKVAQLSVGDGWTAPLYEGNYKKFGTPPADLGNAHVYMNKGNPPSISLKRIGDLAAYSVKGKPVDVTEFGVYQKQQDDALTSAFMHEAPFDAYLLGRSALSVYALHDDMSGVVAFYDSTGNKRAFADYWHYTTELLSDPNGKKLPSKDINITFTNQVMAGAAPLGIKNVLMYKSDGSIWIAAYDEEKDGARDGSETIMLDKKYSTVKVFDGRSGVQLKTYSNVDRVDITLPANHVYLISAF